MTGARGTVRAIGLVLAAVAAVAVFVLGGQDGGTDWQVPALVLIGVLVLILGVATSGSRPAVAAAPAAGAPPEPVVPGAPSVAPAPAGGVYVPGLPQVNIPAGSFPDPGHAHGPVRAITPDQPPPPLHEVLRPVADEPPPFAPPSDTH
jgi:hypothetical protein